MPFEPGGLILQRCVLFLKTAHPLTEPDNFADQLFDKLAKIVTREVFGGGRQHKNYEPHPAPFVNREKILICPEFRWRNGLEASRQLGWSSLMMMVCV